MTYTHVGRRSYVGHYAVTADACRTPGKLHALNRGPGTRSGEYLALCGTKVREGSDDHFLQDERNVVPVEPGHRITCGRCRKALGIVEVDGARPGKVNLTPRFVRISFPDATLQVVWPNEPRKIRYRVWSSTGRDGILIGEGETELAAWTDASASIQAKAKSGS